MVERVLIFDVDGTLTGPRRVIHEDFARFLRSLLSRETVYLVSGSDLSKLQKQLPLWLMEGVAGIFTCSGNAFMSDGKTIYVREHDFPQELMTFLRAEVDASDYRPKTGNHIEQRSGALNVSTVGRNANMRDRMDYLTFDAERCERETLIETICHRFPEYEASGGGQISVDVMPKGWNKGQIYPVLVERHPQAAFHFFGDNTHVGGNDRPLAEAVLHGARANRVHSVDDHFETWALLEAEFSDALMRRAG